MGSLNHLTLNSKTITPFLHQLSTIGSLSLNLDDLVSRLESEMHKIDAFKRELPLCMLLINDAIAALKEESMAFKSGEPVLEEFIPVKKTCDEDGAQVETTMVKENGGGDKKTWLSSTQLWNTNDDCLNSNQKPNSTDQTTNKRSALEDGANQQFRNRDMAFNPLKGCSGLTMMGATREKDGEGLPVPGLSIVTPGIKRGNMLHTGSLSGSLAPSSSNDQSRLQTGVVQGPPPQQQTSRKQRRCWSTELHRRFVDALQQLGGSQAATPKQIRELMQVDGLTNDEVKSHLQKYRLHTRRLPSSNTSCANKSVGVLGGGLGMLPQDQCVASSKHGISQSGSPDGPLLIGTTSITGGDSMDDGEESKSENYGWKGV